MMNSRPESRAFDFSKAHPDIAAATDIVKSLLQSRNGIPRLLK